MDQGPYVQSLLTSSCFHTHHSAVTTPILEGWNGVKKNGQQMSEVSSWCPCATRHAGHAVASRPTGTRHCLCKLNKHLPPVQTPAGWECDLGGQQQRVAWSVLVSILLCSREPQSASRMLPSKQEPGVTRKRSAVVSRLLMSANQFGPFESWQSNRNLTQ